MGLGPNHGYPSHIVPASGNQIKNNSGLSNGSKPFSMRSGAGQRVPALQMENIQGNNYQNRNNFISPTSNLGLDPDKYLMSCAPNATERNVGTRSYFKHTKRSRVSNIPQGQDVRTISRITVEHNNKMRSGMSNTSRVRGM